MLRPAQEGQAAEGSGLIRTQDLLVTGIGVELKVARIDQVTLPTAMTQSTIGLGGAVKETK